MHVRLFALTTCPYCRMAKKYLDGISVDYETTEVDKLDGPAKEAAIAELREISGGASFPVVVIDDEVIVGFNKKRLKELLEP